MILKEKNLPAHIHGNQFSVSVCPASVPLLRLPCSSALRIRSKKLKYHHLIVFLFQIFFHGTCNIRVILSIKHDIVSGFQNGADDYVIKPFELSVLYSRIQAVLRRTGNVAEQYLSCDVIMMDLSRRTVSCGSEEIDLSVSEYGLLLYLLQKKQYHENHPEL